MRRKTHLIVLGTAAAGILIAAISVAPAGGQAARVKRVPTEVRTLAPDISRKLTTASSREVVLQSIKGLPQAPAPVAQKSGPAPVLKRMIMPGGPGKPKTSASATAAGAPRGPAMSTGYDKIDWKAGVFISPFSIPRYGTGNWPVATVGVHYIENMDSRYPGVLFLGWPAQQGTGYYMGYYTIDITLEMPETPALYTLALKVARPDGTCSESWVQNRPGGGPPPLYVWFGNGFPIPMTKLIDDSGFIGIVNLQPGPLYDGTGYGMRAYNTTVQVLAHPWSAKPEEGDARLNPLVFGGIVITLLQ